MTRVVQTARIFRYSAAVAYHDFGTMYTVRSWVFEWLTRIVSQVIFFSLMGRLVGSEEQVEYLLIGNSVMLASMTVMFVVQTTSWERMTGTLPLLVAAPASPLVVFMGRSVEWIPDALATAVAGLVIVAPMFGVSVPLLKLLTILPLLLLVTLSTYLLGTFLGSLVLRKMEARNLVASVMYATMMAICGVNVPTSFFPKWVQTVSNALPLTHGLRAIRAVLSGRGPVVGEVLAEVAVGAAWGVVALASFRWLAEGGRKDGSIEFGS